MEAVPDDTRCKLSEALDESDLPFKVDIIEWNKISQDFRDLIKNDLVRF